jgi:hypothetical protein
MLIMVQNLKKIYLQNSFILNDPLVSTIPIGLENYRLGVNGNPKFIEKNLVITNPLQEVLFGPFSFTHISRQTVMEEFENTAGPWRYVPEWVPPKKFNQLARSYKFVGAVRGNGVDTHRLWEALYRGNIPIVQRDAWASSLSSLDLPILMVDEWKADMISEITKSSLHRVSSQKIPSLWIGYWQDEIRNICGG